jgi:hypothetical protein
VVEVVECEIKKPIWIVRWHVSYDSHSYNIRFEEWHGTEDKVIRLTKTEPKMYRWKCEIYGIEDGVSELTMTLFLDRPKVVFATGRLPERLREALRRLPPSTYYLVVA